MLAVVFALLLPAARIPKADDGPYQKETGTDYKDDDEMKELRQKVHGHLFSQDLQTNSFWATSNVVKQVEKHEIGKVINPALDHACLIGCDAINHCLDPLAHRCQIPSCKLPSRYGEIEHAYSNSDRLDDDRSDKLDDDNKAEERRDHDRHLQAVKQHLQTLLQTIGQELTNRLEDGHPLSTEDREKLKSAFRSHEHTTEKDDDDEKLPPDTKASLGAASWKPGRSKRFDSDFAVDVDHYRQCHQLEAEERVRHSMGMDHYEYIPWDWDTLAAGAVAYAQDGSYGRGRRLGLNSRVPSHPVMEESPNDHVGCSCSCAAGFIDMRCQRLHQKGWYFMLVTMLLLFAPVLPAWYSSVRSPDWGLLSGDDDWRGNVYLTRRATVQHLSLTCFVMCFGYLMMLFGPGTTINCHNGRQIFWGRLFGWLFAKPLLVFTVMGVESKEIYNRFENLMIALLAVLATILSSSSKISTHWFFFYFRLFCVCKICCSLIMLRPFDSENRTMLTPLTKKLVISVLIAYLLQMVVWQFGDGSNWLCADWAEFCYGLLDLLMFALPLVYAITFRVDTGAFEPVGSVL